MYYFLLGEQRQLARKQANKQPVTASALVAPSAQNVSYIDRSLSGQAAAAAIAINLP
jgi:hypothetical protein